MREVTPKPLTAEAFRPFGDVIEAASAREKFTINYGNSIRFHDLAAVDVQAGGGRAGISLFRTKPLKPPIIAMIMEHHPHSSQAFIPLSKRPYLVVVAPKGPFDAAKIEVFKATGEQGVNYHAGTWHHFSLALEAESDFLVIDRISDGSDELENCVEVELDASEQIVIHV